MVRLVTDRTERLDPGSVLESKRGPMTVRSSRPHQGHWIVQFDGVADRNAADGLRGIALLAPPLEDPDALWVHELVGSRVVDATGAELGTITAVEANPASDLLVLDGGGLVPLTFMVDRQPGIVIVDIPAGLLDL
ncbi:MAG: rRNA processing protein RimM [Actinomycetota bacterium]|nr:rRNA processing protein RimM [Actinomycetota bacterium]